MIYGYCRTNLDDYRKEDWPTEFSGVPRIGERVESKSRQSLKVCGITYTMIDHEIDARTIEHKQNKTSRLYRPNIPTSMRFVDGQIGGIIVELSK